MTDKLHLVSNPQATASIRAGFGDGLVAVATDNPRVVALTADLTKSICLEPMATQFPDRFWQVGVAEQNLVTVASGLAAGGLIPFAAAYAAFSPGRNWEQIRTTICLNQQPVRVVGAHAGLGVGPDGATHQALEDLALMRVIPHLVVLSPIDYQQAYQATRLLADDPRPAYLRLSRQPTPRLTTEQTPLAIGPAYVYRPGQDLTLLTTGVVTSQVLAAAGQLAAEGLAAEVVVCPTVKPLDRETILASLAKTRLAITIEDHQVAGGFGSAVAELTAAELPLPVQRLGVNDQFGQSGSPEELYRHYGLDADAIANAARRWHQQHKAPKGGLGHGTDI